jgi:hypothetical protein
MHESGARALTPFEPLAVSRGMLDIDINNEFIQLHNPFTAFWNLAQGTLSAAMMTRSSRAQVNVHQVYLEVIDAHNAVRVDAPAYEKPASNPQQ